MHTSSPKHDHFEFNSGRNLFLFECGHRILCAMLMLLFPSLNLSVLNWFHLCSSSYSSIFLYLFFFHVLFVLFLFPILLGVYYFTWCKHKILLFFFGVWLVEFLIYVACDSYLLECEIKRVQLTLLPTLYYQKWQPSFETINNSKPNFFFKKKEKHVQPQTNRKLNPLGSFKQPPANWFVDFKIEARTQ